MRMLLDAKAQTNARVRQAEEKIIEVESLKRRAERELEEAKDGESAPATSSDSEDATREIRRLKGEAEDLQLRLDRAKHAEKDANERLENGQTQIRQLEVRSRFSLNRSLSSWFAG